MFRKHTRRAAKAAFAISFGVALLIGLTACGGGGGKKTTSTSSATGPKPTITVGTKNFAEEFILGQLYAQALRAKGFTVNLHSNIGPSEVMDRRLASAAIDGYPEYTGTILSVFGHDSKRPASALEAYRMAAAVERHHNAGLLAMAPAEDTDVLVTTPAYATAHGLHSLRQAGLDTALIGVDSESLTGANRLYESVGFRIRFREMQYESGLEELKA